MKKMKARYDKVIELFSPPVGNIAPEPDEEYHQGLAIQTKGGWMQRFKVPASFLGEEYDITLKGFPAV